MTVIHGTSGDVLVNRTNSIASAFQQLRNFTGPCKFNNFNTLFKKTRGRLVLKITAR